MKKIFLILPLFLVLFSCKKVIENIVANVDIPYTTAEITLPASLFTPPPGTTELRGQKDEVETRDGRIDNFQEARLKALSVTLTAPDSLNLGVIKEVYVYLLTDATHGNLTPKLIAQKVNIPANTGKDLTLDVMSDDVIKYLQQGEYIVRTEAVLRRVVTVDVKIKNNLVFNLKPKL